MLGLFACGQSLDRALVPVGEIYGDGDGDGDGEDSGSIYVPPGGFDGSVPVNGRDAGGRPTGDGGSGTADSGSEDFSTLAASYLVNVAHTGSVRNPTLTAPLARSWQRQFASTLSYPLILHGAIYIIAQGDGANAGLYALSQQNQPLWGPVGVVSSSEASAPGDIASLAYDNGAIYTLSEGGTVSAFDAASGAMLWRVLLTEQWSFTSPITAYGGLLYVGGSGDGGTVFVLDETNGATLNTTSVENGDESSPAIDGSRVYVSYACTQAYALTLGGTLLWHHATGCEGGGGVTPVVFGGSVYERDQAGDTILDAASGNSIGTFVSSTAPGFDGTSAFFVTSAGVTAVTTIGQAELWSQPGDGALGTPPVIANGTVYVGSAQGNLYGFNEATGTLVWQDAVGAPFAIPTVVADATATLASAEGILAAPAGNTLYVYASASGVDGGAVDASTPVDSGTADSGGTAGDATAPTDGGCVDQCTTLGAPACDGNFEKCEVQANGCLGYTVVQTCSPHQVCAVELEGCECAPSPCSSTASVCAGSTLYSCLQDANGCFYASSSSLCTASQANGEATCSDGACTSVCNAGYVNSGGTCTAAPQLLSPLSTSTVETTSPYLRWVPASGTDGSSIDVCNDRACSSIVTTLTTDQPEITLVDNVLAPGAYFWRVRGTSARTPVTPPSAVWEFWVGPNHVNYSSAGTTFDVNGDGRADLALSTASTVAVYVNQSGTLASTPTTSLPIVASAVANAGDINGDGFADLLVTEGDNSVDDVVQVYLGGPSGIAAAPSSVLLNPAGATRFGGAISAAGDVNGDGFGDVAIVAYGSGDPLQMGAYVYLGGPAGLSTSPAILPALANNSNPSPQISSVAGCDVTGDGLSDIVVGITSAVTGEVLVFPGSTSGVATTPAAVLTPKTPAPNYGANVACAGDVTGYGEEDLLVGAPNQAEATDPSAYFYFGGDLGEAVLLSTPSATQYTFAMGTGDVNADGFNDVIIGGNGSAFFFAGTSQGPSTMPTATLTPPDGGAKDFGEVACGAGDVNGDGVPDVVVTAPYASKAGGEAFLFAGGAGAGADAGAGLASTPFDTLTAYGLGEFVAGSVP
jgi:outer membrane protein assembly factor BamB